jgi:hypothetical protein
VSNPADELRQAVAGREYWSVDGDIATYEPPTATWTVRVRPSARPATPRDRFVATQFHFDRPTHTTTCRFADEAVRWAERSG